MPDWRLRMVGDPQDYVYARRLVQTYYRMMTIGCGDTTCKITCCRSNTSVCMTLNASDAVVQCIYLATQAPQPLCIPLETSEHPEVDDEENEDVARCSTPRRRLSNAMELDLALNLVQREETSQQVELLDTRRLSLPKQKLMDAIKKSFSSHKSPTIDPERTSSRR